MTLHLRLLPNDATHAPVDVYGDAAGRPIDGPLATAVTRRVLAVPATQLSLHRLPLAAATPAQAQAAARRMLSERVARREAVELSVGDDLGDGHRWVAVFAPEARADWQRRAGDFRADAIVPDCLLLPSPAAGAAVVASVESGYWRVRTLTQAFSAEPAVARAVLGALADGAVAAGSGATLIDLLRGACAPPPIDLSANEAGRRSFEGLRRVAALLAAVVIAPLLGLAAMAGWHAFAAHRVEARAAHALMVAMPDARGPGTPLARAQAALSRQHAGDRFPHLVAAMLQAQAFVPQARIQDVRFGGDGVLSVDWQHAAPGDVDLLRTELERRGVTLVVDPSTPWASGWRTSLLLGDRR